MTFLETYSSGWPGNHYTGQTAIKLRSSSLYFPNAVPPHVALGFMVMELAVVPTVIAIFCAHCMVR